MKKQAIERRFSFRTAGLLLAASALLTVTMAAQQEVSPEHFEANQGRTTTAHKPTTRKSGQRMNRLLSAETKAKSKPRLSASVKTSRIAGSQ